MPDRYEWPRSGNPVADYMRVRRDEAGRRMMNNLGGAGMTGMAGLAAPVTAPVTAPLALAQAIAAYQNAERARRYDDAEDMWSWSPLQPDVDVAAEARARYGGGRRGPQ